MAALTNRGLVRTVEGGSAQRAWPRFVLSGCPAHSLIRGERAFSSVTGLQADRYVLLAEEPIADETARLLAERGQTGGA